MMSKSIKTQQGLSLIELMIAVVLGIFITGGMIQLFVNSSQSYRVQENLSRVQENGRFAMNFITRDIRQAGYFGCMSQSFDADNADIVEIALKTLPGQDSNIGWDMSSAIEGFDDIDADFSLFADVVLGTDVIVIKGLADNAVPLIPPYSDSAQMFASPQFNADCPATDAVDCHEGEILMVTDCKQATIFQTTQNTNIGGGTGVNVVHSADNSVPGNSPPPTFVKTYSATASLSERTFISCTLSPPN